MGFQSYFFILAFLPLTIVVYYGLQRWRLNNAQTYFLIACSCVWIGLQDIPTLFFVIGSVMVNYCIAKHVLLQKELAFRWKKVFLVVGIVINVGVLAYVRYGEAIVFWGISFVTFQQIMFLVDSYQGKIGNPILRDYLFYLTFFPKYLQGPIVKYQDMILGLPKQNVEKNTIYSRMSCGLYYFSIGLAKKVLLADVLAKGVAYGWDHLNSISWAEAILTILLYTLQIYFDFSGYSHMAIGIAHMLGVTMPDNFDNPYLATSIADFWKRWHISLTTFLREYIYIPLGGNQKGILRTLCHIMIVYLISGVWHGAEITFLVWGAMHGLASCIDRLIRPIWIKVPKVIQWIATFSFVNVTWVFFRAPSLECAMQMLKKAFMVEPFSTSEALKSCFHTAEITFLCGRYEVFQGWLEMNSGKPMYGFILIAIVLMFGAKDKVKHFRPTIWRSIIASICLFGAIISLSSVVGFIYENF